VNDKNLKMKEGSRKRKLNWSSERFERTTQRKCRLEFPKELEGTRLSGDPKLIQRLFWLCVSDWRSLASPHVPKGYPGFRTWSHAPATSSPGPNRTMEDEGLARHLTHPRNNSKGLLDLPTSTLTQLIRITKRTKQLLPYACLSIPPLQIKKNIEIRLGLLKIGILNSQNSPLYTPTSFGTLKI